MQRRLLRIYENMGNTMGDQANLQDLEEYFKRFLVTKEMLEDDINEVLNGLITKTSDLHQGLEYI